MLSERTRNKIEFVKVGEEDKLKKQIDPSQIEVKYKGNAADQKAPFW